MTEATKTEETKTTKAPILSEAARRLQTKLLIDTGLAAMDAYEATLMESFNRARSLLVALKPWAEGEAAPEAMVEWARIHRDMFVETDESNLAYAKANADYHARWMMMSELTTEIIDAVYDHAIGVTWNGMDESMGNIRKALEQMMRPARESMFAQQVIMAFDVKLGAREDEDGDD